MLARYVIAVQDILLRPRVIGLWVMTGVIGLVTAGAVLITDRKRPISPWLAVGLLPMAISGYFLFS